jgi:hypothetical protein
LTLRKKTSVILSLSKDQFRNDTDLWEDNRRSDRPSSKAAIIRGLILRQAQDDGILQDKVPARMFRQLALSLRSNWHE